MSVNCHLILLLLAAVLSGFPFPLTETEESRHHKRRSGSNPGRLISLELSIKSGGGGHESKLTLHPSLAHGSKASVEWLKALKKVRTILNIQMQTIAS